MRTLEIKGIEFATAGEAIQYMNASPSGRAIRVGGKSLVVEQAEIDRLESMGIAFAFLTTCPMRDGSERIVTVPVN